MPRKPKEDTETENEQSEQPVELTAADKVKALIEKRKADAEAKALEAQKAAEEAEALDGIDVDSEVEEILTGIEQVDKDVTEMKNRLAEEIKPLQEQINTIKEGYDFESHNKLRQELHNRLVEKLGESATRMLTGKGTISDSKTGAQRTGSKRETAIRAVCDEGLTLKEAAIKYDMIGSNEDPLDPSGDAVRKNLWKPLKDGIVVQNQDGTYSRA